MSVNGIASLRSLPDADRSFDEVRSHGPSGVDHVVLHVPASAGAVHTDGVDPEGAVLVEPHPEESLSSREVKRREGLVRMAPKDALSDPQIDPHHQRTADPSG